MNNKIIRMIVIAIIVLLVLATAKNLIAKGAVENAVRLVTGLELKIKSLKVGVIPTVIDMKGMRLLNPSGFVDRTMIDAPEIFVHYDLPAVIGGTAHLPEVRLDVHELIVVKNTDGRLNLDSLKAVQAQKESKAGKSKAPAKPFKMKIDQLKLKIGKVIYKDYSRGGAPTVMEFNLNLDENYSNITNANALAALIVSRALMNTTLGSLVNLDVNGLQNMVTSSLGDAPDQALQLFANAKTQMGQTVQASGVATKAEEAAKKAASALGDVLGSFGSK